MAQKALVSNQMKLMTKFAVLLALVLGPAGYSCCYGDLFGLQYTFDSNSFGSGTVVQGVFDGTAQGDLITDISNAAFFYNGAYFGPIFYQQNTAGTGPAVVSFDGTENDFIFAGTLGDAFISDTGPQTINAVIAFDIGANSLAIGPIDPRFWYVVDYSTVPDSAPTVLMLGLGIVGLVALHRWRSRFRSA
jgi:hypothetical protein